VLVKKILFLVLALALTNTPAIGLVHKRSSNLPGAFHHVHLRHTGRRFAGQNRDTLPRRVGCRL
jgi:hypothetical protein